MVVIFPNAQLAVRAHAQPKARDPHGQPITTDEPEWGPPLPGSVLIVGDGVQDENNAEAYSLRLDPQQWPVKVGDEVSDGTDVYVVTAAKLNTIAKDPTLPVAFVKCTAVRLRPLVP